MLAFITLFVGLITGIQTVELAVAAPVARVELRLGDRVLGVVEEAPWVIGFDLGREIHPGELVAVGFDEHGRVVASAAQRINLPDRRAEAGLLPETDDEGRVKAVRVTWESPEFGRPKSMRAWVDDEAVKVSRNGRIDLSNRDDGQVHVLTVDLTFPDDVKVKRELVFGTGHAGEASYQLTAIPVFVEGEAEPTVDSLQGLFSHRGKTLRVAAVENGPAQLVVVRDRGMDPRLEELVEEKSSRREKKRARRSKNRIAADGFAEDVQVRLIAPVLVPAGARARAAHLFPFSDPKDTHSKGLIDVVHGARYAKGAFGLRRLADAVAVAGMRAATDNVRRAVILTLGPESDDVSAHRPEVVRAYLADLGVPLYVWRLHDMATPGAWGAAEDLSSFRRVRAAVRLVRDQLAGQRIVWLAGQYLPQEIELSPEATGLRLVK